MIKILDMDGTVTRIFEGTDMTTTKVQLSLQTMVCHSTIELPHPLITKQQKKNKYYSLLRQPQKKIPKLVSIL